MKDLDKLPNQRGLSGTGRPLDQSDTMIKGVVDGRILRVIVLCRHEISELVESSIVCWSHVRGDGEKFGLLKIMSTQY
jgi:hypothetical protein